MKPLPPLAAPAIPLAIAVPMLRLVPGETMIWDVQWRGLTIGRAELVVDEEAIHSKFATGTLASSVARAKHQLVTVLDRGGSRPVSASDILELDGTTTHVDMAFHGNAIGGTKEQRIPDGNVPHTLHSALGVIRAWASAGAPAGFLFVVHAGEVARLDVTQPVEELLRDTPTLKIEGTLRVGGDTIAIAIWLSADHQRMPLKIELSADDEKIIAELIAS